MCGKVRSRIAKVTRKLNEPLIKADLLWSIVLARGTQRVKDGKQDRALRGERTKRVVDAADPPACVMRLRNYVIRGWSARQYVRVNVIIKESITYSAALRYSELLPLSIEPPL